MKWAIPHPALAAVMPSWSGSDTTHMNCDLAEAVLARQSRYCSALDF